MPRYACRLLLLLLPLVAGCWPQENTPLLYPAQFEHMPGWRDDRQDEALAAFRHSCALLTQRPASWQMRLRMAGGRGMLLEAEDLRATCEAAQTVTATPEAARDFFATHFTPYLLTQGGYPAGPITGYYAPLLKGARRPSERFAWPVYRLPPELSIDPRPVNFPDRAAIEAGALAGRGLELLWLEDPVMRFFLQVQGSGYVELEDGKRVQLRFAGKNGHPYVPIGKRLIERGVFTREQVSMPAIRDWLYAHPEQQAELFNQNPAYVFFSLEEDAPPVVGGQGVPLTPGRSLAVDADLYAYGLPIFLTTAVPCEGRTRCTPWQRLMVAQDTGSAIRGPVRADLYFGEGETAEFLAGHMNSPGSLVLLVPNAAVERYRAAP